MVDIETIEMQSELRMRCAIDNIQSASRINQYTE